MTAMWRLLLTILLPLAAIGSACAPQKAGPVFKLEADTAVGLGFYRSEFPNDLRALKEYESRVGQPAAIIHWFVYWGGWKSAFSRSDLEIVRTHGSIPMITWEPWTGRPEDEDWALRNAILSGRNDGYIESWARGLAEYGQPVLLRFAHEMHNESYPWVVGVNGNTAEDYVAAWKYVHGFFERAGAGNVRWVWNPNTLGDARPSAYDSMYGSLYPGDDYVDWLGLDVYNTGPNVDWGAPRWRSFDEILGGPYRAIAAVSEKPLILAEMGSAETGGSKADWIADALSAETLAQYPRLRALVWFDVVKEAQWELRSSQEALDSWTAAAKQPVFKSSQLP